MAPKRVLSRHPLQGLLLGLFSWHAKTTSANPIFIVSFSELHRYHLISVLTVIEVHASSPRFKLVDCGLVR